MYTLVKSYNMKRKHMNNNLHLKEDITVSSRCYSEWTHADTRKNRHKKLGNINQMLWRFRGEVYCLHSLQSSLNEQHMWSCRRLQPLTQENLLLLRTSVCLRVSHHKLCHGVMFSGNTKKKVTSSFSFYLRTRKPAYCFKTFSQR